MLNVRKSSISTCAVWSTRLALRNCRMKEGIRILYIKIIVEM